MKEFQSLPKVIVTSRLLLIPFTTEICHEILNHKYDSITLLGLQKGENWPDADLLETLPRIIINLAKVSLPTGFESWMIVKKDTCEIIGDIGFKGLNSTDNSCDIGYGIIVAERKKGYAEEASRSLIKWVLERDPSITITASTLVDNSISIHLLDKLGFKEVARDTTFIYWRMVRT